MKILTLEFQISNNYGTRKLGLGAWHDRAGADRTKLASADDVTNAVNNAIKKLGAVEIVDVKTDFVTVCGHNNGGANTVMEYVTILWR